MMNRLAEAIEQVSAFLQVLLVCLCGTGNEIVHTSV